MLWQVAGPCQLLHYTLTLHTADVLLHRTLSILLAGAWVRRYYLYCAPKVTPLVVESCSIKAGLQPVPAGLAPVQARLAFLHKESHLLLHKRVAVSGVMPFISITTHNQLGQEQRLLIDTTSQCTALIYSPDASQNRIPHVLKRARSRVLDPMSASRVTN